ncbi:hypothetical protein GCK72_020460 [Caenorhabditis remanei]|uniref:Uncharacterized protein n=1 Tax=Caenorhabditis remanei TaxID=31234 RepID=A0A6A5GGU8_CAERE|nr:hypothetical protein GCK72_020460 [Caenorhabditis remanei]KAF1753903.1 hypothetical protein GCK72_020460 [Caenorhabditis remanei]
MVFDGDPKKTVVFPESSEGLNPALVEEYESADLRKRGRMFIMKKACERAEKMLRTYTKGNASTYDSILKPVIEFALEMMQELEDREKEELEARKNHDSLMDRLMDVWSLVEERGAENIELFRENLQLKDEINFLHELLAEKRKGENMKSVQTEEQYFEKVHISNSNVETVTVKTETKCSNDNESENKLIDYRKARKSLCEGQGIAKIVFENELDYSEDRVSRKAGNAKEIFVMKSNNVLCCEDIKADEIQSSCTKSTHEKDENIGVTDRCTEANTSDGKLCSGDQTPGKAQRSVTFTQYETKKQSVQQKIVSDVIDSNVDLVKDQEERDVQNTVLEKESMQLLKNMLVVENTKHDYKANRVSSMDCDSYEDEAKRKKVDQKSEDTVTCPGPPLNSKSNLLTFHHTKQQKLPGKNTENVVRKNYSSDFKIPNLGEPRHKKKGDGAGGVVFQRKTKRRKREEPRPRTDPPSLSMTYFKDESIPNDFSVTVACDQNVILSHQSISDHSTCGETKSKRVEEEPRPRKDPPQSGLLNWSDTKTGRVKEEPRPRKDPPHSDMMVNDTWRHTMAEHRPRKDPPISPSQQYGHHGNLFGCRNQGNRLQDTTRNLISC